MDVNTSYSWIRDLYDNCRYLAAGTPSMTISQDEGWREIGAGIYGLANAHGISLTEMWMVIIECDFESSRGQECPEDELVKIFHNWVVLNNVHEAYVKAFDEKFTSYLNGSLNCSLTKNPLDSKVCQIGAQTNEYVAAAASVMASVVLFATGVSFFAPKLAESVFPW